MWIDMSILDDTYIIQTDDALIHFEEQLKTAQRVAHQLYDKRSKLRPHHMQSAHEWIYNDSVYFRAGEHRLRRSVEYSPFTTEHEIFYKIMHFYDHICNRSKKTIYIIDE